MWRKSENGSITWASTATTRSSSTGTLNHGRTSSTSLTVNCLTWASRRSTRASFCSTRPSWRVGDVSTPRRGTPTSDEMAPWNLNSGSRSDSICLQSKIVAPGYKLHQPPSQSWHVIESWRTLSIAHPSSVMSISIIPNKWKFNTKISSWTFRVGWTRIDCFNPPDDGRGCSNGASWWFPWIGSMLDALFQQCAPLPLEGTSMSIQLANRNSRKRMPPHFP